MSRVLAIANQKGGVGKTTTAINLSASLAMLGQSVLAVDLDPQGNLTSGLGQRGKETVHGTIYEALARPELTPDLKPFILQTSIERLSLIPANQHLTGAEIELVALTRREERLKTLLESVRQGYDFVFVDCPPSLGLLTLNALVAADAVLIPLHCEYFALEGLADLIATLRRVRVGLNPGLDIAGVLLTMLDERTNLGQQVARDVRSFFKHKVFQTTIPRNIRLGEAPSHGLPAALYDAKSRGAEAYHALARELLERSAATAA